MQLYLVQHGAAKSEAEAPQRSLTTEGTKTVELVAKYLSSLRLHVGCIEHSDKQRARQTAEIMAAHFQPKEGTREVGGLTPNDDVGPMRERLQNDLESLMIVGHLPYLSRLVSALLGVQQDRTLVAFQRVESCTLSATTMESGTCAGSCLRSCCRRARATT